MGPEFYGCYWTQGKKGIWLKLPTLNSNLVHPAIQVYVIHLSCKVFIYIGISYTQAPSSACYSLILLICFPNLIGCSLIKSMIGEDCQPSVLQGYHQINYFEQFLDDHVIWYIVGRFQVPSCRAWICDACLLACWRTMHSPCKCITSNWGWGVCVEWAERGDHLSLYFFTSSLDFTPKNHCVIWLHIKDHAVLGFTPDRVPCVILKFDVKSFLISKSNNTLRYVGVTWFVFHALQRLSVRFTQWNSYCIIKSIMKHVQKKALPLI